MTAPVEKLLDRLALSFGKPGESGDIKEIHHVCCLIRDYISEVIKYEEYLYFSSVPDKAEKAVDLLKDCMGSQVEKLESMPETLDEVVSLIDAEHEGTKESPKVIQNTIIFDLPKGWERKMGREIRKLGGGYSDDMFSWCTSVIVIVFIIFFAIVIL